MLMMGYLTDIRWLDGPHREQARSHRELWRRSIMYSQHIPCGSEPARDSITSVPDLPQSNP